MAVAALAALFVVRARRKRTHVEDLTGSKQCADETRTADGAASSETDTWEPPSAATTAAACGGGEQVERDSFPPFSKRRAPGSPPSPATPDPARSAHGEAAAATAAVAPTSAFAAFLRAARTSLAGADAADDAESGAEPPERASWATRSSRPSSAAAAMARARSEPGAPPPPPFSPRLPLPPTGAPPPAPAAFASRRRSNATVHPEPASPASSASSPSAAAAAAPPPSSPASPAAPPPPPVRARDPEDALPALPPLLPPIHKRPPPPPLVGGRVPLQRRARASDPASILPVVDVTSTDPTAALPPPPSLTERTSAPAAAGPFAAAAASAAAAAAVTAVAAVSSVVTLSVLMVPQRRPRSASEPGERAAPYPSADVAAPPRAAPLEARRSLLGVAAPPALAVVREVDEEMAGFAAPSPSVPRAHAPRALGEGETAAGAAGGTPEVKESRMGRCALAAPGRSPYTCTVWCTSGAQLVRSSCSQGHAAGSRSNPHARIQPAVATPAIVPGSRAQVPALAAFALHERPGRRRRRAARVAARVRWRDHPFGAGRRQTHQPQRRRRRLHVAGRPGEPDTHLGSPLLPPTCASPHAFRAPSPVPLRPYATQVAEDVERLAYPPIARMGARVAPAPAPPGSRRATAPGGLPSAEAVAATAELPLGTPRGGRPAPGLAFGEPEAAPPLGGVASAQAQLSADGGGEDARDGGARLFQARRDLAAQLDATAGARASTDAPPLRRFNTTRDAAAAAAAAGGPLLIGNPLFVASTGARARGSEPEEAAESVLVAPPPRPARTVSHGGANGPASSPKSWF